jgi:prepilin-type N-terminal cleavage/methylation domain-containing protein
MKPKNFKAFTLVEVLVAVAMLGILSTVAYIGVSSFSTHMRNGNVEFDLRHIRIALDDYSEAHFGSFPVPVPGEGGNVLCFDDAGRYIHDCEEAAFIQGVVDNSLLSARYLQEVPLDPNTGNRYAYGVSSDGSYYQAAGIVYEDGKWKAMSIGNHQKGFFLPSLIRAYDSSGFVKNGGEELPYSPEAGQITATIREIVGMVEVCRQTAGEECDSGEGQAADEGERLFPGDTLRSDANGSAVLYFSDGSVAYLTENSTLEFEDRSEVSREDGGGIFTKIKLKLFSGEVWNKVARLTAKSEYNIETTSAIAGVRGTEFGVFYTNTSDHKILLRNGELDVTPTGGGSSVTLENEFADNAPGKVIEITGGSTGSERVMTDTEKNEIQSAYYDITRLHSGHVPYVVAYEEHKNLKPDIYLSFNNLETVPEIEFDGIEVYSELQFEDNRLLKEGEMPKQSFTGGNITYITDSDHRAPYTYRFTLDYNNNDFTSVAVNSTVEDREDILLRAWRCTDPNDAPNCHMESRIHSAFLFPPLDIFEDPDDIDEGGEWFDRREWNHLKEVGSANPGLAFTAQITGKSKAAINEPVTLGSIVRNADHFSYGKTYSWLVMEKPEGANADINKIPDPISNEETSATITGDQPGNYLINLNVWKRGSWDPAFQADSWHTLKLTDENPETTCNSIGGYWDTTNNACFVIADGSVIIGESRLLTLEERVTSSNANPPSCNWQLGELSGDAEVYTASLDPDTGGNFTAPWATGTAKVSCPGLSLDGEVTIGMGDYTLVADFTDSLPSVKTTADAGIGNETASFPTPAAAPAYTLDSTGLKITPGDGNYFAYDAEDNFPSSGSMEIHINKSELSSAGFGYLFEAEDDNGDKVEIYRTDIGGLVFRIAPSTCAFNNAITTIDNELGNELRIVTEWDSSMISFDVLDENDTKLSDNLTLLCSNTPPSLNFGNGKKMYIGSRLGGAQDSGVNTQYNGKIKMIKISK